MVVLQELLDKMLAVTHTCLLKVLITALVFSLLVTLVPELWQLQELRSKRFNLAEGYGTHTLGDLSASRHVGMAPVSVQPIDHLGKDASYSFDKAGFAYQSDAQDSFFETTEVARRISYEANFVQHSIEKLHILAREADKRRRRLLLNAVSRNLPLPPELDLVLQKQQNSFIQNLSKLAPNSSEWIATTCRNQQLKHVLMVNNSRPLELSTAALLQRSFSISNVSYDDEIFDSAFSAYTKVLRQPYCDLRKCPQKQFPFIYLVIPHRNRIANLVRLVSSVKNSALRCDKQPPWLHCLCFYVSDYDTDDATGMLENRLASTWKDRIRLISRRNVTGPWIKTKTYNSAIRYIPTNSKGSLVFHMDADLVALNTSFIDSALSYTHLGKNAYFPIVMGTRPSLADFDQLMRLAINGDLATSELAWVRSGGRGMMWYYLYDNCIGYFGAYINQTHWGGEDNEFALNQHHLFEEHQMGRPLVKLEPSLWHIHHPQIDWTRSRDGIRGQSRGHRDR